MGNSNAWKEILKNQAITKLGNDDKRKILIWTSLSLGASMIQNLLSLKCIAQIRPHILACEVLLEIVLFSRKFMICQKFIVILLCIYGQLPRTPEFTKHWVLFYCILVILIEMTMLEHNSTHFTSKFRSNGELSINGP